MSTEKEPFDAGDASSVKVRKQELKGATTIRIDTLKTIMSTVQGRSWIWWLLGQAGIHHTSFSPDPYRTSFNEGQRNLGLIVFAEIHQHCAGDYAKMVNEAQSAEQEKP